MFRMIKFLKLTNFQQREKKVRKHSMLFRKNYMLWYATFQSIVTLGAKYIKFAWQSMY